MNEVVMHLAMDTKRDDALAKQAVAHLPADNPPYMVYEGYHLQP